MTRQTHPLPRDLHPTGDCTDRPAAFGMQEQPLTKDGLPSNEALLALARLLGRQAARAFLRDGGDGMVGFSLAGAPSLARYQTPCPATAQTDPSSDAF
jgi:hypothetical protein